MADLREELEHLINLFIWDGATDYERGRQEVAERIGAVLDQHKVEQSGPVPLYLTCPKCNARHIDEGEFATKPHHTHSCQSCGLTWRPAVIPKDPGQLTLEEALRITARLLFATAERKQGLFPPREWDALAAWCGWGER